MLLILFLLLQVISYEYILPQGSDKCFTFYPQTQDTLLISYKIQFDTSNVNVQLRNANNYVVSKEFNQVEILMKEPHSLCFSNHDQIETTVEFDVRSKDSLAKADSMQAIHQQLNATTNFTTQINWEEIANNTKVRIQEIHHYMRSMHISILTKIVVSVGFVLANLLIFKYCVKIDQLRTAKHIDK